MVTLVADGLAELGHRVDGWQTDCPGQTPHRMVLGRSKNDRGGLWCCGDSDIVRLVWAQQERKGGGVVGGGGQEVGRKTN